MLSLHRLVLTDFRNYAQLDHTFDGPLTVLTGPNGSGKTNLLEALSLLAPGRGFRGASLADFPRAPGPGGFAVAVRLQDADGPFAIGTGMAPADTARRMLLDGAEPGARAEAARRCPVLWLTPQMERLFGEAASGRRKFLDRLVAALDASHGREIASHDRAVANRNRLLARPWDAAWLRATEDAIARHAVAATAARRAAIGALNGISDTGFPAARLALACPVADLLAENPALAAEAAMRARLAETRAADTTSGATSVGAHRADLRIADAATGRPAANASTGEQKALLVGIVLAHAALTERNGRAPLLLLDEPLVHLDGPRREALFAAVAGRAAPTLLTGTDAAPFAPLDAVFLAAAGGTLAPSRGLRESPI